MAFMIEFALCVPGIKKFTLFGEGKIPGRKISLGVVAIYQFGFPYVAAFRDFIDGNGEWDELIAKNAPALRLHRKAAVGKARKQADAEYACRAAHWQESAEKYYARAIDAERDCQRLNQTVRTLSEMVAKDKGGQS